MNTGNKRNWLRNLKLIIILVTATRNRERKEETGML